MNASLNELPRFGYIDGTPKRINERVVDGQWVQYLGEYAELVKIQPIEIYKLFGGTMKQWFSRFPDSLHETSIALGKLCEKHRIKTLYVNMPTVIPYLLMARNDASLDLGLLFLAHSVGSEFWLKQWVAIAPLITKRDVLLVSTHSSKEALKQISNRYEIAKHIPLSIELPERYERVISRSAGINLLSIGRLEDVKNIHLLLEVFAMLKEQRPNVRLKIAGEYTGSSEEQINSYQELLNGQLDKWGLHDSVEFTGPVSGEAKNQLFRDCDILINLSTDPGETFGYILIEAQAWGMAIICTRWDGFQEIVNDGQDGLFIDCSWDGDVPQIDREQIIEQCLRLLDDRKKLQAFSDRAFESVRKFDYRTLFPQIVDATNQSLAYQLPVFDDLVAMLNSEISELKEYYQLDNLVHANLAHKKLLTIAGDECGQSLEAWMPLAKPVIHHFAGRGQYAEL
ncbi:glycosyltransferase family 4 protein [Paenibacillus sp. LPE1-1-1.1]|uniref:glycosyltransferase family 4 protein n=1 Tax=Paenibacillus sp. LPE1-1-1.1 TaxID=3135230 RepID=UPI003445B7F7